MSISNKISQLMNRIPGRQRFGIYRFLPFFFILGGAMEWFMINVRIADQTFYDVYRRKQAEKYYQELEEK